MGEHPAAFDVFEKLNAEARALIERGYRDLTWAFPLILSWVERLDFFLDGAATRLVVDSPEAIAALEERFADETGFPIHVWLKVDCGLHRAGVDPECRGEIADLFVRELDVARTDDPAELTAIARRLLREQFARASLGISGVNFAVAETGSILVLENEGNIRLTTTSMLDDRYGDVVVDTARSMEVYREWLARTRPAPGPDGLRRPLWLKRPLRPTPQPGAEASSTVSASSLRVGRAAMVEAGT